MTLVLYLTILSCGSPIPHGFVDVILISRCLKFVRDQSSEASAILSRFSQPVPEHVIRKC